MYLKLVFIGWITYFSYCKLIGSVAQNANMNVENKKNGSSNKLYSFKTKN